MGKTSPQYSTCSGIFVIGLGAKTVRFHCQRACSLQGNIILYIYISEVLSTHRSNGKISGLHLECNKISTESFREFLNKHPLFLNEITAAV
jgi:hypothetical protein